MDALLARYRGFLLGERGISPVTARLCVHLTQYLLESRFRGGELDLAAMAAADVIRSYVRHVLGGLWGRPT